MKVTNLITGDVIASVGQAQSSSQESFGSVLASVTSESKVEQVAGEGLSPSSAAAAGSQGKIPLASAALDAIKMDSLRQAAVGEQVREGPSEDVAHQKLWSRAEELVDFDSARTEPPPAQAPEVLEAANGSAAPADEVAPPVAMAALVPQVIADAPQPLVAASSANEEGSDKLPAIAVDAPAAPSGAPTEEGPALLSTPMQVQRKVESGTAHTVEATSDRALAGQSAVTSAPTEKKGKALADPDWAHATVPSVQNERGDRAMVRDEPVRQVQLTGEAKALKATTRVLEAAPARVSGAAAHAVKVLHAIEVVDEVAEVEVVEGELVDPAKPASTLEQVDVEVVVERSGGKAPERSVGPVNLGKPMLAMVTQEMLQTSVADRGDGVPANIAAGAVQAAAPVALYTAPIHGAVAAHQALHQHQVVVATTPHRLVPDLGVEIAREANAGKSELSIRLDPAELGRVDIRMTFSEDGRMRAVIAADNPSTFDLLKRDSDALVKTLADAGVKTDAGDLRFDMRQGGQSGERNARPERHLAGQNEGSTEGASVDNGKPARSTRGRLV